jgi:hypothetical protein
MRTAAAADPSAVGTIVDPLFGGHGTSFNGGAPIGSSRPADAPPFEIIGHVWQKGPTGAYQSVPDPNFHPLQSGAGAVQSIASATVGTAAAVAANVVAAATSFTTAQWTAIYAALNSSLSKDSGGTGNISAPSAGVSRNFSQALTATGQFTAAQVQSIIASIGGALSLSSGGTGHIVAPSSGGARNIEAALHNAFSTDTGGGTITATPIINPNPTSPTGTDPSQSLTGSLLGLGDSGSGGGGIGTDGTPVLPLVPQTSSGPPVALLVALAAIAAIGIFLYSRHKHNKEHAAK